MYRSCNLTLESTYLLCTKFSMTSFEYKGGILMDIQVSGHHVSANDMISSVVKSNLEKIGQRYPSLVNVAVILKSESKVRSVEARTIYEGSSISVSSEGKTIRDAIKTTTKKLEMALSKRKGLLRSGRNEKLNVEEEAMPNEIENDYDIDDQYTTETTK